MIRMEINNNRTKLSGDIKPLKALYKHLSFKHPEAYHIQQHVKYKWDGMVHPLSNKGWIATGLLERVVNFLFDYGEYDFEVIDHRRMPEVGSIPDKVGILTLRPYQRESLELFLSHTLLDAPHPRGLFLQAVNAGKTLEMFALHLSYKDARTIILLNSSVLYKQMKQDLVSVFGDDAGWMQGKRIKWGKIMVVMAPTLKNRLKDYQSELLEYNILLTDEADLATNKVFKTIYTALSHISVRAAFTGTAFMRNLKKDSLRNNTMVETFGEVIHEVSMKNLEDWGHSTKLKIKLIKAPRVIRSYSDWMLEFKETAIYEEATHRLVLKRIKHNQKLGRRYILVVTKFIEQAEILFDYLKDKVKGNIEYIHHKKVGDSIDRFRDGDIDILISTLFIKRGMNLPLIQTIISVADGEFYTNPIQVIGRGTRLDKSKDLIIYEDILFNGKYLASHSRQRIKYYKGLKVEIKDYS